MSKIIIKSEIDAKTLLSSVAQLKLKDIEAFINELTGILTRKKAKDKKYQIAAFLLEHNQTVLNKNERNRYEQLYEKLEKDTINESERQEYLTLTKKSDQLRNKRVKLLIKIAHLRAIPFNDLLKELGLKPVGNA